MVSNLLDYDAIVDLKDQKQQTPLFHAIGAKAQNYDVVKELIKRGANINSTSLTGMTPLLLATKNNHTRIVQLLLN